MRILPAQWALQYTLAMQGGSRHWRHLVGTAGTWFLFDVAYYGAMLLLLCHCCATVVYDWAPAPTHPAAHLPAAPWTESPHASRPRTDLEQIATITGCFTFFGFFLGPPERC